VSDKLSSLSNPPHFSCSTDREVIPLVNTVILVQPAIIAMSRLSFIHHIHPSGDTSTPTPLYAHSSDVVHGVLDVIVELNLRNVARVWLALTTALTGIVGNVEHGVEILRQIGTSSRTNLESG